MPDFLSHLATLGVELELGALFLLCALGTSIFDKFEVETAIWKKLCRWGIATVLTLGVYASIGHWALLVLIFFAALGIAVHFSWCRKHGIHPVKAEPRDRYYLLRGWQWPSG
jgi:hypothetical protein